jgi:hypothetical protein
MTKVQKGYRFSDLTVRQIEQLATRWGATQSETISIAIDRIYQQENVMSKTVEVEFDPAVLPAWARKHPAVVELSRANLSYRVNVCDAKDPAMRRVLIRQAETR